MGNLLEMAELVWLNLHPNGSAQTSIDREEIVSTALAEYAAAMWIYAKEQELATGGFEMPSEMITTVDLPVVNKKIDISSLDVLRSLPGDAWLLDIEGCRYMKSSLNQEKKLVGDDSAGNAKTFYVSGKSILFPKGTHADILTISYANTGSSLDPDSIEANDYVLSKVRDKLYQLYGQPVPADVTANSNPND